MRFKLNENLPREASDLLRSAGHDAITVGQQMLGGANDGQIYQVCREERRALISLDADFANVRAYEPKSSHGVIVLRLARQDRARVLEALTRILPFLEHEPFSGQLWIVHEDRVKIRE